MIFVTVGAQMPFDRMIRAVDDRAGSRGRYDVFAQIGDTDYRPRNIRYSQFLDPSSFRDRVEQADAIIAHAGMGSILTALEFGKPILVFPRRGDLKETRNDHQVDTARQLLKQGRVNVAMDEFELMERMDLIQSLHTQEPLGQFASPRLIHALRGFIEASTEPVPAVVPSFDSVYDEGDGATLAISQGTVRG